MSTSVLLPSIATLIERLGGTVRITRFDTDTTLTADGAFARAIDALLERGEEDPVLGAVDHDGLALLRSAASAEPLPLTRANAITLGGLATLFIEVVGQCNERCLHCYADSGPEVTTALDRTTCEQVLEDAAALGISRVQFTGGDPLLCEFLPSLVVRAKELGIAFREVYTNGLALSDAKLDSLAEGEPAFAFSFYSHRADVHDAITRTKGSQARTTAAILRTLGRGFPVRVSVIVMEENAGDLAATIEHLRGLGVETVHATSTYAVGRGARFNDPDGAAFAALAPGAHGGAWDSTALGKLCVASNASVYPCIFNRNMPLGDLRQSRLREIAAAPALAPPRRSLIDTDKQSLQCFECRLTARALRACG